MTEFERPHFDVEEINYLAKTNLNKLVEMSEKKYTSQIDEMINDITNPKNDYKVILLSGPSSAGKTTTSNLIRRGLEDKGIHSIVISLDDFFVDREKTPKLPDGSYDFESIYALDLNYFNTFLGDLLRDKKAKMPIFDFLTGKRKENLIDVEITEDTIVIFEGIHALNPVLTSSKHSDEIYRVYLCLNTDFYMNGKLFLSAKEVRLMRRMLRDHSTRGHSISATYSMWKNVLDGEEKYIKPFKNTANYLIDTTHLYEPTLYATYLTPLLEKVEGIDKITKMIAQLHEIEKLKKSVLPKYSLLWEFLIG